MKLAGRFMAVGSSSSITVTDLRTGARTLTVKRRGPLMSAIGDDGTVIVGRWRAAPGSCRLLTRLAWYSPSAPSAHPIHYRACARTMFLIGHKLVFQSPAPGSLVAIQQGSLAGSKPQTLARFTRRGSLLAADGVHVLAVDDDCHGGTVAFVAPGGTSADPSSPCGGG